MRTSWRAVARDLLRVAAAHREADEPGREAERLAPRSAEAALAAGRHDERVDAVAGLPALDAAADLLDVAGDLDAERVREVDGKARDPFADVDVEVVQGAGPDPDRHLAGARLRVVDLLQLEDIRVAELVEPYRLHAIDLRVRFVWEHVYV